VVPVPDEEFGARPFAFVRTNGVDLEPEYLAQTLEPVLPRFKIPISFHPWPAAAGGMKPDRAAMGERARRLHGGG
jgi:O-succinylbenzoic acid--CoA ligase